MPVTRSATKVYSQMPSKFDEFVLENLSKLKRNQVKNDNEEIDSYLTQMISEQAIKNGIISERNDVQKALKQDAANKSNKIKPVMKNVLEKQGFSLKVFHLFFLQMSFSEKIGNFAFLNLVFFCACFSFAILWIIYKQAEIINRLSYKI